MTRLIDGWWSFDDVEQALIRRDGASISYRGDGEARQRSALRRWMRFSTSMRHGEKVEFEVERIEARHIFGRKLAWRAHLPAGVSRELVELLLDGLAHWPDDSDAGMRPGKVELVLGSAATSTQILSTGAATLLPAPRPDRDVPVGLGRQSWQWLAAEASAGPLPALPDFELINALQARDFVAAAMRHVPVLVSDDAALFPLWLDGGLCHWVYFDNEFLTDRIALNLPWKSDPREWTMSVSPTIRLGTRTLPDGRLATLDSGPIRSSRSRLIPGVGEERSSLPQDWAKRIHDAIMAASFLWQDCTISVEDRKGDRKTLELLAPDKLISRWAPGPGGRLSEIAESRRPLADGDAPPAYLGGRIAVEADPPVIRDIQDNRSLAFVASLAGASDAESVHKFRLVYRDSEGSAALVIDRRPRETPWHDREWIADLRDGGFESFDELRWRAAREFIGGALCHWPDSEATGPAPPGVRLLGALVNGRWDRHAGETLWCDALPLDDPGDQAPSISEPPRRWDLIVRASPSALLDLPAETGQPLPPFDRSEWIAQFPDRTAWYRDDGKAVFSIAGIIPPRGHGGGSSCHDYRDEDVWLRLSISNHYGWTSIVAAGPVDGSDIPMDHLVRRSENVLHLQPILWGRLRDIREAMFALNPRSVVETSGTRFAGRVLGGGSKLYDSKMSPLGDYRSNLPR